MARPRSIGPYEVVRELGRGAMGVVFEVRHPAIPRPLALKLTIAGQADVEALARFEREAQALAKVRHPHVLLVHQLGRAADGPYLVTELVEGRSLRAVTSLAHGGAPLEPRRAAEVLRALADALGAVHAQGIVHRDLKPDNVLLRPDGAPVLLDFGIARDRDARRLTRTGELLGTPAFMAPEQAMGDARAATDPRVDVYGLGAVLFAALAGRPPFDEGSLMTLLTRVVEVEPEWPPEVVAAAPDLVAVGRVAMAKAPDARYASALELRDDLDRVLRGEPPLARTRAGRRRPRARRAGLALLVAVAVAVVVALGGFVRASARAARAARADAALAEHLAWERGLQPWCLGLAEGVAAPSLRELGERLAALETTSAAATNADEHAAAARRLRAYQAALGGGGALDGRGALALTADALRRRAGGAAPAELRPRVRAALDEDPTFLPAQLLDQELRAELEPQALLRELASSDGPVHPPAMRRALLAAHVAALERLDDLDARVGALEREVQVARARGVDLSPLAAEKRRRLLEAVGRHRQALGQALARGQVRCLDVLSTLARLNPEVPARDLVEVLAPIAVESFTAARAAGRDREALGRAVRCAGWLWRAGGRGHVDAEEVGTWCEAITLEPSLPPLDDPVVATDVVLAYLHFGPIKDPDHLARLIAPDAAAWQASRWPDSAAARYLRAMSAQRRGDGDAPARLDALDQALLLGPTDLGPAALPRAHLFVATRLLERTPADTERALEHVRRARATGTAELLYRVAKLEVRARRVQGRPDDALQALADAVGALEVLADTPTLDRGGFVDQRDRALVELVWALIERGRLDEAQARVTVGLARPLSERERRLELTAALGACHRLRGDLEAARALQSALEEGALVDAAAAAEAVRLRAALGDRDGARRLLERVHLSDDERRALERALEGP